LMYNIKELVKKLIFNFVAKPNFNGIHAWLKKPIL